MAVPGDPEFQCSSYSRVDALSGGLACTAHNHLSPFFPRRSQWLSPLHAFDVRVISSSLGGGWASISGGPSLGGVSVIVLSCELCWGVLPGRGARIRCFSDSDARKSVCGPGPGRRHSSSGTCSPCMLSWAAKGRWGCEGLTLVSLADCLFILKVRPWVGSNLG